MYEKRIQDSSNQFTLCDSGYFIKNLKSTTCENCINNAICRGGYIPLYPDKEYWRPSKDDLNLYYCEKNLEACIGNDTCKIGHTGPLCESCDILNGYGPSGKSCQKKSSNNFKYQFSLYTFQRYR
ncbi:hypothetical protein PPERSA_00090 [Pseudocohnilembus persalinus]|uniref:Uncharacterized protein n=1 Tax=Pseudocohnilembus persalinus TaxID=266149 RepID=A0A0V0Q7R2_PSEPJ|nr:hypothetical protein PPERSA_00090 [Pseudocohnilembus persalinus]|eukprot:KRW98207.1 hypothetical protein PPERSA_00090 [Pseudocohnilembus persalinus]